MTRKRLVVITLIACSLIVGIYLATSYKRVSVRLDPSLTASIYKRGQDGSYDNHHSTRQIVRSGSFWLKKGQYILSSSGSSDFASTAQPFTVGSPAVSLTVHPDYSVEKINKLFQVEEPAILSVLKQTYPSPMNDYSVKKIGLYERDLWAGASLAYHGDDIYDADTLRVVLHKINGSWALVTSPPNVSLSAKQYPQIPWDVLSAINNYL